MSTPKRKIDDVHHSSGSDTETQPSPDLLIVLQPASKRPRAIPFGVPDGSPAAPDMQEPLPSAAPAAAAAAASGSELKEGRLVKRLTEDVVRLTGDVVRLTRHVVQLTQDVGSSTTEHIDRLKRSADTLEATILVELEENGRLLQENNAVTPTAVPSE
jgi:hypothetical protein